MSDFIDSVLLTSNAHPYTVGLLIFALALFVSFSLVAFTMTGLLHSDSYSEYDDDCEDPIFIHDEIRPLLDHSHYHEQDPLRDFPHGRYVSRTVSAKRARKQEVNRDRLRRLLERDWRESSYGAVEVVGKGRGRGRGPRVGEKRKVGGVVEEGEESEW